MAAIPVTAAAIQNVLAVEFHSHDCQLWHSLASGSGAPFIENGFATVPDVPGLGIGELNE